MIVATCASKFNFRRVSNIVRIQPSNHIFEEQALDDRLCEVEEIIDRQHGLKQAMLFHRKIIRGSVDLQGTVVSLNAKAVQRHLQKILPLPGLQIAARRFEVVNDIAIVGQHVSAVLLTHVNLEGIVMPVEIRSGDLDPFAIDLTQGRPILQPDPVIA